MDGIGKRGHQRKTWWVGLNGDMEFWCVLRECTSPEQMKNNTRGNNAVEDSRLCPCVQCIVHLHSQTPLYSKAYGWEMSISRRQCRQGRSRNCARLCFLLLTDIPLPSIRQHLSNDDRTEDKRRLLEPVCAVLCTTLVHSDIHTDTWEQFVKLTVGLDLSFL